MLLQVARVASIRYSEDAPQILLMWVLSLVLVTAVLAVLSLGLYICRTKRKFVPGQLGDTVDTGGADTEADT